MLPLIVVVIAFCYILPVRSCLQLSPAYSPCDIVAAVPPLTISIALPTKQPCDYYNFHWFCIQMANAIEMRECVHTGFYKFPFHSMFFFLGYMVYGFLHLLCLFLPLVVR